MTLKRKSTTATADPGSAKKPRLDADGERPMTDKEKRKAARMIRNRSSAQASRDKKREYLESLESTIAKLQSENKDLRDRMISQNTHQIIHGHGVNGGGQFVLPLSPDPSSIAIPDKQMGGASSENEEEDESDDDDDEDEDDGHSTMAYDRPRSVSAAPLPLPPRQPSKEPAQHSAQYAQALVALTTENATLKTRLGKLEQVVQVLLGMNNGGAAPVSNPTMGPGMGLDILSLLGPDQPVQVGSGEGEFRTLDPSTNLPPQVSPSDISPGLALSQSSSGSNYLPTDNFLPALALPPTQIPSSSTSTSLHFPTTEKKDHARHPAAMTTVPELFARGPALQRACFSSPARKVREARERELKSKTQEQEEMKNKVERGLKRVLEWRERCLPRETSEGTGQGMRRGTLISSVG